VSEIVPEQEKSARRCSAPSGIFDGEVWFIGLARRNVQWTFRQPNAEGQGTISAQSPETGASPGFYFHLTDQVG
jgi:hypothetical protein